jgi:hypothetical protein
MPLVELQMIIQEPIELQMELIQLEMVHLEEVLVVPVSQ